jgi:hypothetical protein
VAYFGVHDGLDVGLAELAAELLVDGGHGLLEALAVHVAHHGDALAGDLLDLGLFGVAVGLALERTSSYEVFTNSAWSSLGMASKVFLLIRKGEGE